MAKKHGFRMRAKAQSMIDNSNDSRNSTHGYMEMGNDAKIHAKARALRNSDNGSHL
ncbi:hypothetical protein [Fonticella tunisiensis]|uniref:Uncharacterized protein n=1 Tax=Fonticella tunisiensis TaxID=1096341 RepID=A0A4V3ETM9_9CLOT|nr:hypothetical protein [Fonticella tunisiensis]TDT61127.1 hypothetical protein EDD71_10824 [Fonticella tunisiensis]